MLTLDLVDDAGVVADTIIFEADGGRQYVTGAARQVVEGWAGVWAERGLDDWQLPYQLERARVWIDQQPYRLRAPQVLIEAGWEPTVPNVLLNLREAGSDAKLRAYWTSGPGAAKIRWGAGGDFDRCVARLGKYVSDPKGLCNEYHQLAVGAPPGKGH